MQVSALLKVCLPEIYKPFARQMLEEFAGQGLEVVAVQDFSSELIGQGGYLLLDL